MTTDDDPAAAVREAFSVLNHEIRLEILLALLEDWHAVYTEPRSYAELMDAVGMRDSGQFNYHLDKLRGVYVRKVEGGYVPTASVTALYRTVLGYRPTEDRERDPARIEAACPRCAETLLLRYERGFVTVDCPACDDWIGFTYPFPRNGFDGRRADAVARATARRAGHHIGMAREGQCPFCAGTTTVDPRLDALEDAADGDRGTDTGDEYWLEIACDTCTFLVGVGPLATLQTDGRVARALAETGIDIGPDRYDWELPTPTTGVESHDPVRIALEVDGSDGTVTIVVDEAFDVRSVTVDR